MLNVIPILATKKIAIKYIYKIKLRRNLNISSQKLTKHKRREECKKNEGQKSYGAYEKQIAKWQKSPFISKYLKYKWNKFSNQKTELGKMAKKMIHCYTVWFTSGENVCT